MPDCALRTHVIAVSASAFAELAIASIVAAAQKAFVVITPTGEFIRNGRLPNKRAHPQTEGIAISGSSIFLADEGQEGKGVLSHYANGF